MPHPSSRLHPLPPTAPVWACVLALTAVLTAPSLAAAPERHMDLLQLPPGFAISVYAEDLPGARSLALGPDGIVFVGSRRVGSVYAVVDGDGDRQADETFVIAEGLNQPNGVAYRDGSLYVAEIHRILRYDGITDRLADPPEAVVVRDDLPTDRHHGWKFIRFGPDGLLYVPVGAPCNVCEVEDPYASLLRMSADGSDLEVYARGIRNTVGFDWHPESGDLWFTENGRDMLGDDTPPDELNRAASPGLHFGYPTCHGNGIPDPELGGEEPCRDRVPPARELGPHVAAVGMRFYTGDMFPADFANQIILAEHGSWNRSDPIGYRIMKVDVAGAEATSYEVFIDGWLQGRRAWGRPVDVAVLDDGSLLVSDDMQGVVYRVTYGG